MDSSNLLEPGLRDLGRLSQAWDTARPIQITRFSSGMPEVVTIFAVYVDDIVIAGDEEEIIQLKSTMIQVKAPHLMTHLTHEVLGVRGR